ncbi:MAG: phosphopentomutase [Ruminococcaceae bacterium]|nr:phosphopentomutase [Oscillospiraceae bacterium]
MKRRVFLIVLDSFGVGAMPDAEDYGDSGSSTIASVIKSEKLSVPTMSSLGLFNIAGINVGDKSLTPIGAYARLAEKSKGKDTTVGHWEIAGIISEYPLPVFPNGFPDELINRFETETGRKVICNLPYSGTEVLKVYGEEHMQTGNLIVYTSADSVFQIAAHEEIVPLEELYDYCRKAREILQGEWGVGRVIARPFVGDNESGFTRTSNRHDFSLEPPNDSMLDILQKNNIDTIGIGKIYDIFAGKGISKTFSTRNNDEGMKITSELLEEDFCGLCFVNLVEFDMVYGHRRNIDGYAAALSEFDSQLSDFIENMRDDDLLIITADHGCDPGFTASTDHTREYVPMLAYGRGVKKGKDLGTRCSFSDISATILDYFNIDNTLEGNSFLDEISQN